jgi:hypothetical protein
MNNALPSRLAVLVAILSWLTASGAESPSAARGAPTKKEDQTRCLRRDEICVTHGTIDTDPSGRLAISAPVVRAVSTRGIARAAELRFTLLGPSADAVPLGTGEMRRQLGLKLRAQNGCNLVYVMWRLEPKNALVVSIKSNPGMRTHAECGTHGYRNVVPARSTTIPEIRPGESHRLRAVLAADADSLEVLIDGASVWSGSLGPQAAGFDGPVGLRTDNVRLVAALCQASEVAGAEAPSTPCTPTKEE